MKSYILSIDSGIEFQCIAVSLENNNDLASDSEIMIKQTIYESNKDDAAIAFKSYLNKHHPGLVFNITIKENLEWQSK